MATAKAIASIKFGFIPSLRSFEGALQSVVSCLSRQPKGSLMTHSEPARRSQYAFHGSEAVRDDFVFSGRIVKSAKVIALLATGFFLLGFAVALWPLMYEGFWPGLGVMLICLGVLLVGTGIADQIVATPKRSRSRFIDKIAWVFVEPFGWISLGLVTLAGGYSVLLGVGVFLSCVLFVVLVFQRFLSKTEQ